MVKLMCGHLRVGSVGKMRVGCGMCSGTLVANNIIICMAN